MIAGSAEAKFARLDVKVTEDVRKIVSALATHKETLEEQERVTSERMGELQKEEEKQLKRLWEALREHKAKASTRFEVRDSTGPALSQPVLSNPTECHPGTEDPRSHHSMPCLPISRHLFPPRPIPVLFHSHRIPSHPISLSPTRLPGLQV